MGRAQPAAAKARRLPGRADPDQRVLREFDPHPAVVRNCLKTLGANVRVCAPPALMPEAIEDMRVTPFYQFDTALAGTDVVMMLRLQQERMEGQFIPSPREYRHLYGLTLERLAKAQPDALV